jgi:hypothetical protein
MTAQRQRFAADFIPAGRLTLPLLAEAAEACRGCDLYAGQRQAILGEGSRTARIMLVGEQPGDKEDRAGLPFVRVPRGSSRSGRRSPNSGKSPPQVR